MDVDAQLLVRYTRTRDAEAFTLLVRRHAGMVYSVAKRITSNHHDAEEVAQDCFLALAREAASIHGSLAGWLHVAATHRAIRRKCDAGNRRRNEYAAARPETHIDVTWDELAPLVDQALADLPDDLRLPLVLFHLQDRTQAEIAAELGIHQSTVSRRLEAGVAALREKLKVAGAMVSNTALPAMLARHAIEAAPKTLVAVLGKLSLSGLAPATSSVVRGAASGVTKGGAAASGSASGVAASGGSGVATGVSSGAATGTAVLALKVAAALALTAAVSMVGIALLPKQRAIVTTIAPGTPGATQAVTPLKGKDVKQFVKRLEAEINQGLGDGVGFLTQTEIDVNNSNPKSPHPYLLTLFAQKGASRLYMSYPMVEHLAAGQSIKSLSE